jgi:hypothetical protein
VGFFADGPLRGNMNITSRFFNNSSTGVFPTPASVDHDAGAMKVTTVCDDTMVIDPDGRLKKPVSDGLGCVRGIWFAILLEVGTGLLLYGVWQLWRTLR